jgi:RHS repeat-associated protein
VSVRRRASGRVHYNYFRDLDPAIGRYIESDPIGLDGGLNTYAYVQLDPISRVDPKGLVPGPNTGQKKPPSSCTGNDCCPKAKIWVCDRRVMDWYGWVIPNHMYVCCGGPNIDCFGHNNNDLKRGDPIPRESSPTGSCRQVEVCADLKEKKCNGPRSPRDAGTLKWNCRDWAQWEGS